jgi:hypothetical protein
MPGRTSRMSPPSPPLKQPVAQSRARLRCVSPTMRPRQASMSTARRTHDKTTLARRRSGAGRVPPSYESTGQVGRRPPSTRVEAVIGERGGAIRRVEGLAGVTARRAAVARETVPDLAADSPTRQESCHGYGWAIGGDWTYTFTRPTAPAQRPVYARRRVRSGAGCLLSPALNATRDRREPGGGPTSLAPTVSP